MERVASHGGNLRMILIYRDLDKPHNFFMKEAEIEIKKISIEISKNSVLDLIVVTWIKKSLFSNRYSIIILL